MGSEVMCETGADWLIVLRQQSALKPYVECGNQGAYVEIFCCREASGRGESDGQDGVSSVRRRSWRLK